MCMLTMLSVKDELCDKTQKWQSGSPWDLLKIPLMYLKHLPKFDFVFAKKRNFDYVYVHIYLK